MKKKLIMIGLYRYFFAAFEGAGPVSFNRLASFSF